jgi:hypothetical protein
VTCTPVTLPNGAKAIVCGPRQKQKRCVKCGGRANLLCDWKTPTPKKPGKTCDKPICAGCTTSPAPDKDLCPEHGLAFADWRASR